MAQIVRFTALETMLASFEYRKVCTKWVPQMLTQEPKNHQMQVYHDLLYHCEAENDNSLDHIITGDEMW
jgi:hypothetical protein